MTFWRYWIFIQFEHKSFKKTPRNTFQISTKFKPF